ncbi:Histone-lysine N-methyltransferase eggless [Orchesella cincta]|uniref:Histone-lysine N-methyltransferase eggless n=1 Tax=Orchesella cincta TaxID=48709 RepID=A0A1D2MVX5_ORCCI|nr:Histone-lysine N-methyltransferase eggless [Orchesella cincta]
MQYLIFFDDGYAQYVTSDGILLICDNSQPVWNDIYAESHDFIKDYINKYPSWPMVRMSINSMVSTEWNGRWLIARVKEVDCAMAKLRFENDGREEWIYRGSPRLRPIYRCTENKETNNTTRPRHDTAAYKNRNEPTVEYNKHHINTDKKSARKSTGGLNNRNMLGGSSKGQINMEDPDVNIEYQGTMEKIKIPDNVPKPKEYVPHACSPECEIDNKSSQDLKKLSPLMIPLFLGWSREVSRSPRHNIAYRAPCGVSLRDYDELNVYMEKINSPLSVDSFCFDYTVDCLAEFKPTRDLQCIRDISYGKEKKPISCVNSVDYDPLPFMEYTPYRIVGDGVSINTSDDFLACCDCTDNCLDKTKCACWKLTEEGIAFDDRLQDENGIPIIGYQNRRLKEHIISGIYECNSKCRCKSTCLNRVVQNGVSFPLQVFKTSKKGWGIRAMHDMPDGSFICIYSGRVLTDHSANEGGKEYGDEYLAELDFIEINEKVKEDYESDVSDIEANDSMNDEERAENRSQTNDENMESEPEMDSHAGDSSFVANVKVPDQTRSVPIRRTNGQKRNLEVDLLDFHRDEDSITARTVNRFNPQISPRKKKKRPSARTFFGTDESVYIMDAKSTGNLGRYLNHSCMPNVFVQNVFVDTHDIRFPLVAFFTNKYIRAGTELTWDYHYEINSVSGRTLYCFCGTPYCRNRLL